MGMGMEGHGQRRKGDCNEDSLAVLQPMNEEALFKLSDGDYRCESIGLFEDFNCTLSVMLMKRQLS